MFLVLSDSVGNVRRTLDELPECDEARNTNLIVDLEDLQPRMNEIRNRLMRLYSQVNGWPAPFTSDQNAQFEYLVGWIERIQPQVRRILDADVIGCGSCNEGALERL